MQVQLISNEVVKFVLISKVPKQFLPAIEKGIRRVLVDGAIAGYPMEAIRVSVYDGKFHPVDSKEVAFVKAGARAFIDAVQKAKPALLEPFVSMEITVNQDLIGDIASEYQRLAETGKFFGVESTVLAPHEIAKWIGLPECKATRMLHFNKQGWSAYAKGKAWKCAKSSMG